MSTVYGPVPFRRLGQSLTELIEALHHAGQGTEQVQVTLKTLKASGQAYRQVYRGEVFWRYAGRRKSRMQLIILGTEALSLLVCQ